MEGWLTGPSLLPTAATAAAAPDDPLAYDNYDEDGLGLFFPCGAAANDSCACHSAEPSSFMIKERSGRWYIPPSYPCHRQDFVVREARSELLHSPEVPTTAADELDQVFRVETGGSNPPSSSTIAMEFDWSVPPSAEEGGGDRAHARRRRKGTDGGRGAAPAAPLQLGMPRGEVHLRDYTTRSRRATPKDTHRQRPFVCGFPGCEYRGTREDTLQVHQARCKFRHHEIKPSALAAAAAQGGASAPSAPGAALSPESPFARQEGPCLQPAGGESGSGAAQDAASRARRALTAEATEVEVKREGGGLLAHPRGRARWFTRAKEAKGVFEVRLQRLEVHYPGH
ncbi:hypothetical protein T492DRAFT_849507 [Pavlovales sp. CCMP2436]|nr:hypothetical protein T492DRAFT_849507 [Pavlovales sp. CCMP2436]